MDNRSGRSPFRIVCLMILALWSCIFAMAAYPQWVWRLGAAYAAVAFGSIFLRVGWIIPFALAGTYVGMFLDPPFKGGTVDAQMWETVWYVVSGTVAGMMLGFTLDLAASSSPSVPHSPDVARDTKQNETDEQQRD